MRLTWLELEAKKDLRRLAITVDSQVHMIANRRIKCLENVKSSWLPDYFLGTTESFIAFPNRNFKVVLAGI